MVTLPNLPNDKDRGSWEKSCKNVAKARVRKRLPWSLLFSFSILEKMFLKIGWDRALNFLICLKLDSSPSMTSFKQWQTSLQLPRSSMLKKKMISSVMWSNASFWIMSWIVFMMARLRLFLFFWTRIPWNPMRFDSNGDPQERVFKLVRPYFTW